MTININNKNHLFFIPFEDKYIVYMPFKPLAFLANEAMKNFIQDLMESDSLPDMDNDIIKLLHEIGYFQPETLSLEKTKQSKVFKPTVCVLLLTTACNLKCVYCYASSGQNKGKTISIETGKKAIDIVCQNAIDQQLENFSLSLHGGGEPTLAKKELFALMDYAKQKELKCRISLTTNGYLTEEYTEALIKHGISEISLSFDGLPKIQNKQRPVKNNNDSSKRILKFIKQLERHEIPYGIRLSVMDNSVKQLPAGIEFLCKETSSQVFQVEPVFAHGRAEESDNFLKNNQDFIEAFMTAHEIAYKYNRHLYYSGVRPWVVSNTFCLAPELALIVNHDSELTACYEVYDKEHEQSDMFFYGTLPDKGKPVIDFQKRKHLFKKIEKRKADCRKKDCFCYYSCAGDCPPKAFHSDKNSKNKFSPRCELNRNLTKEILLFYIEKSNGVWNGERIIE